MLYYTIFKCVNNKNSFSFDESETLVCISEQVTAFYGTVHRTLKTLSFEVLLGDDCAHI